MTKQFILCCLSLLCAAPECGCASDWLAAGPLFADFQTTLSPGRRMEAAGPLFYFEQTDTQSTWAVTPLLSHRKDPVTDLAQFDCAYPVITYSRYGSEYRWQLLQLFSFAGGQSRPGTGDRRLTVFPVYFQQRSSESNQNYTALFPVYGNLKNRLFRDEIFFVMFPVYGRSRKGDVVTDNYLYPFFHLRHGEGLEGWQFWPFTGHEHKGVTTRTNNFGDAEIIGGHDSRFVLWPFYFHQQSGIGTGNPQQQKALLPFCSCFRSPGRDSTTVLWPFFTHTADREKKYDEWDAPWPIIKFGRGEGKTVSRVWPVFSHAQNANLESAFLLWPMYKYNRVHSAALDRERTRILFFLYSDLIQKNIETGAASRRVDFWPFFTHRRDYNGNDRLQIFSILEPLLPYSEHVERDYSLLWSLWRLEKNPGRRATSRSFLWNLYRCDTTAESKKCSLLLGLFQYQSSSEGKSVRLFHIPVVRTRPSADAGAK